MLHHEIVIEPGHNCLDYECRFPHKCTASNSHGIGGVRMIFYVHNPMDCKGFAQFVLLTGWHPTSTPRSAWELSSGNVIPMDLGYHSRTPHYEGHEPMEHCHLLEKCYYDGSSLQAYDAYHTLVNGGGEELWKFMDQYYRCVFEGGKYPSVFKYPTNLRSPQ